MKRLIFLSLLTVMAWTAQGFSQIVGRQTLGSFVAPFLEFGTSAPNQAIIAGSLRRRADYIRDCAAHGYYSTLDGLSVVGDDLGAAYPFSLCPRWWESKMTRQQRQQCSELGSAYWQLYDAVELTLGALSTQKAARESQLELEKENTKTRPSLVKQELIDLRGLNAELSKSHPDPAVIFYAGAGVAPYMWQWLFTFCPAEIAWELLRESSAQRCRTVLP